MIEMKPTVANKYYEVFSVAKVFSHNHNNKNKIIDLACFVRMISFEMTFYDEIPLRKKME